MITFQIRINRFTNGTPKKCFKIYTHATALGERWNLKIDLIDLIYKNIDFLTKIMPFYGDFFEMH